MTIVKSLMAFVDALEPRAKQFTVISVALGGALFGLQWLQAELILKPAARAGSASVGTIVSATVRAESDTIRALIRGEGIIRDSADSLLWRTIADLRNEVRRGVYSREEIDAMRAASYRRQDSLFLLARRRR